MIRQLVFTVTTILVTVVLGASSKATEAWPQFRGPHGNGEVGVRGLPTKWGGLLRPPTWQTDIPGRGWSSPIVIGSSIWLTSAEQTALDQDSLTRKLTDHPYGEREFQTHASVTLLAVEINANTGKILRRIDLLTIDDPPPIHFTNSYASPTPVTDGKRLFCHFGSLGTVALSLDSGGVLWQRRFVVDDITGPGSSPVLDGDRLILACDGVDAQFVVSLDAATGEERWRRDRPPLEAEDGKLHRSFSTPLMIHSNGRKQIVAPAAQWIVSYDPVTGEELWRVNGGPGMHAAVPRAVYRSGVVYVCTGYPKPELLAIQADGQGDVTDSHLLWRYTRQVPEIASPVVTENEIYIVSHGGILSCLDRESGTLIWQERLSGNFAASPLLADSKLYITNTDGMTYVLRAGRKYDEIARNPIRAHCMASLAVSGRNLLLRSDPAMFCLGSSESGP